MKKKCVSVIRPLSLVPLSFLDTQLPILLYFYSSFVNFIKFVLFMFTLLSCTDSSKTHPISILHQLLFLFFVCLFVLTHRVQFCCLDICACEVTHSGAVNQAGTKPLIKIEICSPSPSNYQLLHT